VLAQIIWRGIAIPPPPVMSFAPSCGVPNELGSLPLKTLERDLRNDKKI